MIDLLTTLVPPAKALAGLSDGSLRQVGGVIRYASGPLKGKIFAHMQEAQGIAKILGGAGKKFTAITSATGNPVAGAAVAVTDVAAQVTQVAQNEVIRRGVKRVEETVTRMDGKLDTLLDGMDMLKQLGVANLALTGVGVGVSLVGFGIMNAKLNSIQGTLQGFSERLDTLSSKIDRVRQDMIDADFLELHSLVRLYEEAWAMSDRGKSEQQWIRVAQDARTYQDRFNHRARELIFAIPPDFAVADPMIDALAMTGGLRVAALMASNEGRYATEVADENAQQIFALTGSRGLADYVLPALPHDLDPSSSNWELELAMARQNARPMVEKMRMREAAAATRTAPLPALERQGISPREWLEVARNETEAPLLLLADEGIDAEVLANTA